MPRCRRGNTINFPFLFCSTEGVSYGLATHCAEYILLSANFKSSSTKSCLSEGENKRKTVFKLDWCDKEVESKPYIHLNLLKKKIINWCSVPEITLGLLNTTRELNFTSTGRHVLFVISYFRFSCDVVIFINKKLPILLSF